MTQFKTHTIAWLMMSLFLFSSVLKAADEQKDYGMQKGDFSISVGAGKNVYFDEEFEFVAPYMVPVSVNFALMNKLELGLRYAPVFFADRSNVTFENATSVAKNHKFGGVQAFGGDLKYAIYNDYGVMAFISGGGMYNIMNKNEYDAGALVEIDGVGYSILGGIGVRYQLGDDDGDLFPWYFEMALYYSRVKYDITDYKRDSVVQEQTSKRWNDLNFNGLDVTISFGYRFRSK
ncbi:MAG: hypothetical protein ACJAZ2_001142 [Glaciecola sp.]|jgi:hypothetical protein